MQTLNVCTIEIGKCLRDLSQWVQLYTGAQINFGDLTPYLTYGGAPLGIYYYDIFGTMILLSLFLFLQEFISIRLGVHTNPRWEIHVFLWGCIIGIW